MLTSTKTAAWYEAKGVAGSGGDAFVFLGEKLRATNVLIPQPIAGKEPGCAAMGARGALGARGARGGVYPGCCLCCCCGGDALRQCLPGCPHFRFHLLYPLPTHSLPTPHPPLPRPLPRTQLRRPGHLHQRLLVLRALQEAPPVLRPRAHGGPPARGGDGVPGGRARGGRGGRVRLPGVAHAGGARDTLGYAGYAEDTQRIRARYAAGERCCGAACVICNCERCQCADASLCYPSIRLSVSSQADSLSERKGSTTVRWARPQGKILVRTRSVPRPLALAAAPPRQRFCAVSRYTLLCCAAPLPLCIILATTASQSPRHHPATAPQVRLQLTKKPGNKLYIVGVTDVEEAERKAEEEKKKLKALGQLEDSDDEEEGGKGKKKPKKKGKDDAPGFFEPGGTFGAAPDPEVVQAFSMRPYKLRVFIYQAVNIPATDSTGSSDPFCVVRCGKTCARTQVCAATSSPAWFVEVVLDVQLPICSRPDMMSFGAMVHNAKFVDRARRAMATALYHPEPYRMKKDEDLPPIALSEPTAGGRLMARLQQGAQ